jgi:hypothetical protein
MDARHYGAVALALLLSSPAFAGGIFTDSTTSAVSVPTTEATLWSENIAGGVIPVGDALRVRMGGTADGAWNYSAVLNLELNGQWLAPFCANGGETGWTDVTVWRTGTTTGWVEYQFHIYPPPETGPPPIGSYEVTGLNWGSSQTLAVKGYRSEFVTATLDRVGVER